MNSEVFRYKIVRSQLNAFTDREAPETGMFYLSSHKISNPTGGNLSFFPGCASSLQKRKRELLVTVSLVWFFIVSSKLTFRRRIKSRLQFAGIIRRLPYSTRFQDKV